MAELGDAGRLRAKLVARLGLLTVRERALDNPDTALVAQALADRVRLDGLGILP